MAFMSTIIQGNHQALQQSDAPATSPYCNVSLLLHACCQSLAVSEAVLVHHKNSLNEQAQIRNIWQCFAASDCHTILEQLIPCKTPVLVPTHTHTHTTKTNRHITQ